MSDAPVRSRDRGRTDRACAEHPGRAFRIARAGGLLLAISIVLAAPGAAQDQAPPAPPTREAPPADTDKRLGARNSAPAERPDTTPAALGRSTDRSAAPSSASPDSPPVQSGTRLGAAREREVLAEALAAFDRSLVAASDASGRNAALRESVRGFESLLASGVRHGALEHNLGNAYFRLGDIGRAVLHFRRAARLAPRDGRIQANLAFARARVNPPVTPSGQVQLWERLLFWSRSTTAGEQLWFAAGFSIVGWAALLVCLRRRVPALATAGLAAVVLGLANAALLAWNLHSTRTRPEAVLVSGQPLLRHGRGEAHDPVRREPLGPGVELRILEQRGDWLHVELRDGQAGWVPATGVERV